MWLLLTVAKAGRSVALRAAADALTASEVPIAAFLCAALALTAAFVALLHPGRWRSALKSRYVWHLLVHAVVLVLTFALWCYGLKYCGPVWTVLLDASEVGIVTSASFILCFFKGKTAGRSMSTVAGLCMLVLFYTLLLSSAASGSAAAARQQNADDAATAGWEHLLGETALLLAAALTALRKATSRRLARELGGSARLFGLSAAIGIRKWSSHLANALLMSLCPRRHRDTHCTCSMVVQSA